MYPVDRSELESYLKKLKLTKSVMKLCTSKSPDENPFGVVAPYKVYSSYAAWDETEVYTFLPLWQSGTEVYAFDLERKDYFVFSMEVLSAARYFESSTFKGLIALLMTYVIESEFDDLEVNDFSRLKRGRKIAKAFEFHLLPELVSFVLQYQEKWAADSSISSHLELMGFCREHAI